MNSEVIRVALTIAGSDSGGGAGIQADLRTFAFHAVHGASAITCVTAQNTVEVTRVEAVSPLMIADQIQAVVTDIGVQATKTGMLLNGEIMKVVASQVKQGSLQPLVVDPVMVSRTGAQLIDDEAVAYLAQELLPLAEITTPNRYEAQILSGMDINTLEDMEKAAQKIHDLGAKAVLVKGGGMRGELKGVDVWFDGKQLKTLQISAVETKNNHGTGCTLSAAITANLALGYNAWDAVQQAKEYVTTALKSSLPLGQGSGPVRHFFPLKS